MCFNAGMQTLSSFIGRRVALPGFAQPVFVADFADEAARDEPTQVVLIHGLGGAHVNWLALGPRLRGRARSLAVDLSGHGRTPWLGTSTIERQVELVTALVQKEARGPVILVGNSMGGLIALRVAAARPDLVSSLLLLSPLIPQPPFTPMDRDTARMLLPGLPLLGPWLYRRRLKKLGPTGVVEWLLSLIAVDPTGIDAAVKQAHRELASERATLPWAIPAFVQAVRSCLWTALRAGAYFGALADLRVPTHILHGERDRIVPLSAARWVHARRPDWTLEVLPGKGHVPMLEAPDLVCQRILERLPTTA